MDNSNEEGLNQTTLKCDDVLEQMKATNSHASQKNLKKEQNFIDGTPITPTPSPSLNPSPNDLDEPSICPTSLDLTHITTSTKMLAPVGKLSK